MINETFEITSENKLGDILNKLTYRGKEIITITPTYVNGNGYLKECVICYKNKKEIDSVDFRNYAFDTFGFDCGTLSGLEKYIEWIEGLICDDEKLKEIKNNL